MASDGRSHAAAPRSMSLRGRVARFERPARVVSVSVLGALLALLIGTAITAPTRAAAQGILLATTPDADASSWHRLPHPPIWPPHPPYPPYPPPRPPHPPSPPTPATYRVASIDIDGRIDHQTATIRMSQTFVNTGRQTLEATFVFPLPYDAAIEEMTLMVDGSELPGELLPADEAQRLYETTVRKNRDPALMQWIGTGMLKTQVFPIPPGQKRVVTIRYRHLCRDVNGLDELLIPLSTAQYSVEPLDELRLRIVIEGERPLRSVYSPTHDVTTERPAANQAEVRYEANEIVPKSDFRLFYDETGRPVSLRMLSYRPDRQEDGYFMLLASPKLRDDRPNKSIPKTVQLVIDRSGSMSGDKIDQARKALRYVLGQLDRHDLFNIITYDSQVEAFAPELQRVRNKTRKRAADFCDAIRAGGSTDIHAALTEALQQCSTSDRPTFLLFLTDGRPTTGVTSEAAIIEEVVASNASGARIFPFGVGYDVNSRLLDRLARRTHGRSEYVRPDESIENYVQSLYRRIAQPVMTNARVEVDLDDQAPAASEHLINRVYPEQPFDLFAGEQLVVVGRYREAGRGRCVLRGEVSGQPHEVESSIHLKNQSKGASLAFIEKLWAVRRIGAILDEIDLQGENDELVAELVRLSRKHGVLTPYTAFLADETTQLGDTDALESSAGQNVRALERSSGFAGFSQRAFKGQLQRAAQPSAATDLGRGGMESFGVAPAPAGPGAPFPLSATAPQAGASTPPRSAPMAEADQESAPPSYQAVRQIADRTFYFREGRWIDSELVDNPPARPIRITRFSDAYFDLAKKYGREMAPYLAVDAPLLLSWRQKAYLIEP